MQDEQIRWQKFLQGNQQALAGIFLKHHDDLFRYGLKLTGDQDMVKDCIQDLFLKLWKNRDHLKMVQTIKPYLFKSLRNHLIDSLQLQKPNLLLVGVSFENFNLTYYQEDFLVNELVPRETRQQVLEALNHMTERQREAIYLRFFQELDFETIAHIMGMNVQSVRNTLQRAMKCMRDRMLVKRLLFILTSLV